MAMVFLGGIALGGIFFGGLWFTVQKGLKAKNPALWMGLSFLLRVSLTLTGFYVLAQGNWKRLLVCLAGFLVARLVITHFTKKDLPKGGEP